MKIIKADNFNNIYIQILEKISEEGQFIGKTRDISELSFCLTNPRKFQLFYKKNWMWAYVELLDRFSGMNPGTAYQYRPNWEKKLKKEGGTFDYSYGEVWEDQLPNIIGLLKKSKNSREAIMTMWNPVYLIRQQHFKRRPCTLTYHFYIRDKKVNLSVNMRTNDVINLLPYDVLHNCILLDYVCASLSLGRGHYYHHATHAYWPKRREQNNQKYIKEALKKLKETEKYHDHDFPGIENLEDLEILKSIWYNDWSNFSTEKIKDKFIFNWAQLILNYQKNKNLTNELMYLEEL